MQYLNKQDRINAFYLIDEELYTFEYTGILTKYIEKNVSWTTPTDTQHFLVRYKPTILYSFSQYSKVVFLLRNSGKVLLELNINFKPISVIDDLIWGVSHNRSNNIFEVYSLDERGNFTSKLITGEYVAITITRDVIVCQSGYSLFKCFKQNEFSELWQLDIRNILDSETTQLFGDLIEYEGKLYFFLSDQRDKYGIYAIDIATGQVVNHTNAVGGYMKLANDLLYLKKGNVITTIHPHTFEIVQTDYTRVLAPKNLNLGLRNLEIIQDNLYYFVSEGLRGGAEATIGILDLNSKSLLDTVTIPIEAGSYWVKEIQVHGHRLFVLTQGGTLHIFEREG
jgi:outer membrane protein assembly factor BamB